MYRYIIWSKWTRGSLLLIIPGSKPNSGNDWEFFPIHPSYKMVLVQGYNLIQTKLREWDLLLPYSVLRNSCTENPLPVLNTFMFEKDENEERFTWTTFRCMGTQDFWSQIQEMIENFFPSTHGTSTRLLYNSTDKVVRVRLVSSYFSSSKFM